MFFVPMQSMVLCLFSYSVPYLKTDKGMSIYKPSTGIHHSLWCGLDYSSVMGEGRNVVLSKLILSTQAEHMCNVTDKATFANR